ncbi:protein FD isoform X1 [Morus notabilis]|uniref:protein FD isoform X1 n=1 Tax=Morus notabilis TaxID=981085 RepID=UPI000CED609F|nr:protein FD isoform X1 [Morus notabilis]
MLSSSSGSEEITNSSSSTTTSNTTKKTKSDYSSSSPKSSFSSIPRTMEEVWKDINLSSLGHDNMIISSDQPNANPSTTFPPPPPHHHPIRNIHHQNNFQDFLARPFCNNDLNLPNKSMVVSSMASPPPPPPPSLHHSATALSLNSGPEFRFMDNPLHPHHRHHNHNHNHHDQLMSRPTSANTNPMNMMINSNSNVSSRFINNNNNNLFDSSPLSFGKRFPSCDNSISGGGSGDRRHKRMVKNRESAARSRARKQAYTNELELEADRLKEENQRLRKQLEQVCQAAAAQLPKKHSLQRTSTAPF